MKRDVQAVILVLIGAALLRITLAGDMYLRYVKAELRPALVAAGVIVLILGLVGVVRDGLLRVHERQAHGGGSGRGEEEETGDGACAVGGADRHGARPVGREELAAGARTGDPVDGTRPVNGARTVEGAHLVDGADLVDGAETPDGAGARPVGSARDGRDERDGARPVAGAAAATVLPGHGGRAAGGRGRDRADAHDGHGAGDHGHDHAHGPRVAWLMCLPVLALFLITPPALGAYTASRSSNAVVKPASVDAGFPALPPGDPLEMTPGEFSVRAVWDTAEHLKGRNVTMLGFVTPGRNGGWYLTRLTLSCCAADARTFKIEMHGAPAPVADTWVRVTGTWLPNGKVQDSEAVPAFTVTGLERVAAPKDPYE